MQNIVFVLNSFESIEIPIFIATSIAFILHVANSNLNCSFRAAPLSLERAQYKMARSSKPRKFIAYFWCSSGGHRFYYIVSRLFAFYKEFVPKSSDVDIVLCHYYIKAIILYKQSEFLI